MKRKIIAHSKKLMIVGLILLCLIFGINFWVNQSTKNQIYDSTQNIPYHKVTLVLGTSKYNKSGYENLYFKYRIQAALELFKTKKATYFIVSGDNSTKNYNEPKLMQQDLIEGGVPEANIFLDYAGFRTLDSVVRAKEIFGEDSITIVSQKFHNQRAVYLANQYGIHAVGFNAKAVNVAYGFKTQVREKLARVKMMLDLIFGKEPKFYGDTIKIPNA